MINDTIRGDIATINRTFAEHAVDAGARAAWTMVAGRNYIVYGLRLGRGERISSVSALLPELAEAVSGQRRAPTRVRLRTLPLALEVPHPDPAPLDWGRATMRMGPNVMLAGRSYGYAGPTDELIDLSAQPHVLIGGITGSGKSTLLRMALLTLAYNTPPSDLRFILIDPKDEDFAPFCHLPHVLAYASQPADIESAIGYAVESLHEQRSERLVVVVDELREVALRTSSLDDLGTLLSTGRSKRVNVLAATQHPTAREIGAVVKANFTLRLAGMVSDASAAALVTGRPQTGAELLPGRGSWLWVEGARCDRFQSYWIDMANTHQLIQRIRARWSTHPTPAVNVADIARPQAPTPAPQPSETERLLAAVSDELPQYLAGQMSKAGLIRLAHERGVLASDFTGGSNDRAMTRAVSLWRQRQAGGLPGAVAATAEVLM